MRITILAYRYPAPSEAWVYEPARRLRALGHEVAVVADAEGAPVDDGGPAQGLRPERTIAAPAGRIVRALSLAGAPLEAARLAARARASGASALGALEAAALARLPEVARADVLLAHFGTVGARWLPAAEAAGKPLAVYFHGFDATRADLARPERYAALFRSRALLLTNGAFLRERLLALGAARGRVRVVPLAAPDALRALEGPPCPAAPVAATIARLVPKKGAPQAVRAFTRATAGLDPSWSLEVIGDGPERAAVLAAAREEGAPERVRLRGFLGRRATLEALSRASIFVLASRTDAQGETEGTPVSAIEAATLGLAVVAPRHAGIPEVLPPDAEARGFLPPEGDDAALAAALGRLARDPALRLEWGRACMAHARARLDEDGHARALAAALEEAAAPERA